MPSGPTRVYFPNAIPVKPLEFDRSKIKAHKDKEIEFAVKILKESYSQFIGTANWVYFKSPKDYSLKREGACHAALPRTVDGKHLVAFENGYNRRKPQYKCSENQAASFLSWFLYYSPYGEFILNRDDFDTCFNYGFIVSSSIPQPIIMNLAIVSRHLYELYATTFESFENLTNKGFDPTICYSFLCNTNFSSSALAATAFALKVRSYSGHRVAGAYSTTTLKNIFNGYYGYKSLTTKNIYDVGSIYGACYLFTSQTDRVYSEYFPEEEAGKDRAFVSALKEYRDNLNKNKEPEVYKPPNPFDPAPNRNFAPVIMAAGDFTGRELVDFVIPYIDNRIRKELNNGK